MLSYRVTLDVPFQLVLFVSQLLAEHRRELGTRDGARALTCWKQAIFTLAWFRDRPDIRRLGAGLGISQATAYRYKDEAVEVLAAKAPTLREALEKAVEQGLPYLILDGTLISSDRCADKKTSRKGREIDKWYSGKAHEPAGNVQALAAPRGIPLWVSDVLPGSTHDLTADHRTRPAVSDVTVRQEQTLPAKHPSRHVRSPVGPRSGSASTALPRMTSVDIAPADQTAVDAMWASYVADSGYDGPLVTAFAFGDSAELADELGLLVLHGPKRATAELVQAFVAQDEPLPRAADRCLVLGGDGRPLAIVRTTDVRVGPLSSVDDRFAWDEGEGDRTRAWWLDAHTRFFSRQCTAMGLTFSDDIGVAFERFELVWPTIRT